MTKNEVLVPQQLLERGFETQLLLPMKLAGLKKWGCARMNPLKTLLRGQGPMQTQPTQ